MRLLGRPGDVSVAAGCLHCSCLTARVICRNLKAARELGMETIRESSFTLHLWRRLSESIADVPIGGVQGALEQLGEKLGIDLTSGTENLPQASRL